MSASTMIGKTEIEALLLKIQKQLSFLLDNLFEYNKLLVEYKEHITECESTAAELQSLLHTKKWYPKDRRHSIISQLVDVMARKRDSATFVAYAEKEIKVLEARIWDLEKELARQRFGGMAFPVVHEMFRAIDLAVEQNQLRKPRFERLASGEGSGSVTTPLPKVRATKGLYFTKNSIWN